MSVPLPNRPASAGSRLSDPRPPASRGAPFPRVLLYLALLAGLLAPVDLSAKGEVILSGAREGDIDFTVYFLFPPTEQQIEWLSDRIREASEVLCNATDGQMRFGQVVITGGFGADVDIDDADVWVCPSTSLGRSYATCGDITDPECRVGLLFDDFQASRIAIAHEFGHLALGLGDEYPEEIDGTNSGDRRVGPCHDELEDTPAAVAKICLMQAVQSVDGELNVLLDAQDQLRLDITGELCTDHVHDLVGGNDPLFPDCTVDADIDGCERPVGAVPADKPCHGNCCGFNFDSCRYEGTHHTRRTIEDGDGVQGCWTTLAEKFSFIDPPANGQLPDESEAAGCDAEVDIDTSDIMGTNQVMLVLDRSLSMAFKANEGQSGGTNCEAICAGIEEGDCCLSALDFLQQSARLFLTLNQTNPDAESGIVTFSSSASLRENLQPVAANFDSLVAEIDDITAGGNTNIGAGLERAHEALLDADDGTKAVLLITDGVQSVPPEEGGIDPGDAADALAADDIRVFTIGTGEASGTDILGSIAETTNGAHLDSPDTRELLSAFALQWANHVNADVLIPKLRYRVVATGTQEPFGFERGPEDWASGHAEPFSDLLEHNRFYFDVEEDATSATLVIAGNMDNMSGFGPRIILSGPGGAQPSNFDTQNMVSSAAATIVRDDFFHMIRLHHPNPGRWNMEIRILDAPGVASEQTGTLSVLIQNPSTRMLTSLDRRVVTPADDHVRLGVEALHASHLRGLEVLEATVVRPDGSTQDVPLQEIGAELSVYEGFIQDFPFQGMYEVRVRIRTGAETTNHRGEPIFSPTAPPNTVDVPTIDRTRSEFFFVVDGQKVCNGPQFDCDNDGIPNTIETDGDKDGDGIPNSCDLDSDGDEVPDSEEEFADVDGDRQPGWCDTDSDGDGIPDTDDPNPNGGVDVYRIDLPVLDLPVDCDVVRNARVLLDTTHPVREATLRFIWRPRQQANIVDVLPGLDVDPDEISRFTVEFEEPVGDVGAVNVFLQMNEGSELPATVGLRLLTFRVRAVDGAPVGAFVPLLSGGRSDLRLRVLADGFLRRVVATSDIGRLDLVGDTTPPVVHCPPRVYLPLGESCRALVEVDATAIDNCDPRPRIVNSGLPREVSGLQPVLGFVRAVDASGNTGYCATLIVPVDLTPPVISCPDDISVPCRSASGSVVTFTPSATDNCTPRGLTVVCDPPSGSLFPVGTTTVECRASDARGNTSLCHFDVTVTCDLTPPPCPVEVRCSVVDDRVRLDWTVRDLGGECDCERLEVRHSPSGVVLDTLSPAETSWQIACADLPARGGTMIVACLAADGDEIRGFCSYRCEEVGSGGQRPFDCNQDGQVDIGDAICALGHLFLGVPANLPCADNSANVTLMDFNGDLALDIADGIGALLHLFGGGPGPVLGPIRSCVEIEGCPNVCGV